MDVDAAALYQLYQQILQMFTEPPGQGLPPANSPSTQFQGDWPPASFDIDVAKAWSPSNPSGYMGLAENIATLVNPVPVVGSRYQPSLITVEQVYEMILDGGYGAPGRQPERAAVPARPHADVDVERPAAVNVEVSASDIELSVLAHARAANEYAMAVAVANARKASSSIEATRAALVADDEQATPPDGMPASIGGLMLLHQRLCATQHAVAPPTGTAFDQLHEKAKLVFDLTARASVTGPSTFHPSYLLPSDFAQSSAASRWVATQSTYKTAKGLVVHFSLSFLRLDIVRSWFNGLLIAMPNWKISGYAAGQLTKLFPLLPTSMIVSRDLTVSIDGAPALQFSGLHRLGWFSEPQPPLPPA